MSSLTTLQLAERIALAVLKDAYDSGDGFMWEHVNKRAPAVLNVLHDTGHWFCRVDETPQETILTPMARLPFDEVSS